MLSSFCCSDLLSTIKLGLGSTLGYRNFAKWLLAFDVGTEAVLMENEFAAYTGPSTDKDWFLFAVSSTNAILFKKHS